MKSVLPKIVFLSFAFVLLIAHLTFAETKTFIKEYTYQASEDDSRNSSRVIALREVKRLLLEELGTYLESETEVKNFQLARDQITTLTAGIVQTEIIEEKWDGRVYWLKSKIAADEDKVVQSINALRKDREKTKELEVMRQKSDELLREVERLRKEMSSAKNGNRESQKAAYDKSIKQLSAAEWIEKGHAADSHEEAAEAYSRAIELDPQNIRAYYFRARRSDKDPAMSDYYKLLSIKPKNSEDYLVRAWTYKELEKRDLALQEFGKAIATSVGKKEKMEAYQNRGRYYLSLRTGPDRDVSIPDFNRAIQDFSRAIELDPKDADNYSWRGGTYLHLQKYDLGLQDYNKAIDIDPKRPGLYSARGAIWMTLKKLEFAAADLSRAIELDKNNFFVDLDYLERARLYEELGKYELAIQDLSILIKREPENSFYHTLRANLYRLVGKYDLAIQDYTKATKLESQNILTYYGRAKVYALKRNFPMSIEDLKKTMELEPSFKSSIQKESAFDSMRTHPDFIKLIGE